MKVTQRCKSIAGARGQRRVDKISNKYGLLPLFCFKTNDTMICASAPLCKYPTKQLTELQRLKNKVPLIMPLFPEE
jgi:hypothetical protein